MGLLLCMAHTHLYLFFTGNVGLLNCWRIVLPNRNPAWVLSLVFIGIKMIEFDFEIEDGEIIIVEYEPVDYDDYGDIEFEISAYKDGKEIWDDLSSSDQHQIETQVKEDWEQSCKDDATDAAISQWQSDHDFK